MSYVTRKSVPKSDAAVAKVIFVIVCARQREIKLILSPLGSIRSLVFEKK